MAYKVSMFIFATQPETRKLQQVSCHQADIRMRSHRSLGLHDNKSVTSDTSLLINGLAASCELHAGLMGSCFINIKEININN